MADYAARLVCVRKYGRKIVLAGRVRRRRAWRARSRPVTVIARNMMAVAGPVDPLSPVPQLRQRRSLSVSFYHAGAGRGR